MGQKKLRQEVMQLEDVLAQLRKEYEMLRIEFEQNLAANEQTGPINREMRHLITSLQNNTTQLKGEVQRYKRKYKEANSELPKVRKEVEELQGKVDQMAALQDSKEHVKTEAVKEEERQADNTPIKDEGSSTPACKKEEDENEQTEEQGDKAAEGEGSPGKGKDIKQEKGGMVKKEPTVKTEKDHREAQRAKEAKINESEMMRDLRAQLK